MEFFDAIFNIIAYFRGTLRSVWSLYTPFEVCILKELNKLLDAEDSEILNSQLKEINSIDRGGADRKIAFFKIIFSKISYERRLMFETNNETWILKKCRVYVDGNPVVIARFFVYRGVFFSIEFNGDADMYRQATNVRLEEAK